MRDLGRIFLLGISQLPHLQSDAGTQAVQSLERLKMRSVKHSGLNLQKVALALPGADVNGVFRSFDLEPQGVKGEIKSLIYQVCGFGETF